MPITFAPGYVTSDGQSWPKLQDAQQREIAITICQRVPNSDGDSQKWDAAALAIVEQRDAVLAILKQKERQRTRVTKPKRARAVAAKPAEAA